MSLREFAGSKNISHTCISRWDRGYNNLVLEIEKTNKSKLQYQMKI